MFRILSIDGGGIRGIIPAKILALLEEELGRRGMSPHICDYFDMICGTSTGGIIAIGLGLGMEANNILRLYLDNASAIFPHRSFLNKLNLVRKGKSFYESDVLRILLEEAYNNAAGESPARIGHSHTRLCIPVYDANTGMMHVFKTSHHPELLCDYQIPATEIALSTAAAPVYFDSHSYKYSPKGSSQELRYDNQVDGGVIANNPTLIGYTEALRTLDIPVEDIAILSLGTGNNLLHDQAKRLSAKYWLYENKRFRLYDLMASAQADYTSNLMKFFQRGVGNAGEPLFVYDRIQQSFGNDDEIGMDDSSQSSLDRLQKIGQELYSNNAARILDTFFTETAAPFEPCNQL